ncbi:hypothetical protein BJV82DRAFT_295968 [Fennellomyces sp. T-0311]|nr:hypothetical protein BJV82DRAFT_295968 [Fennellomyces sp. T-0311]
MSKRTAEQLDHTAKRKHAIADDILKTIQQRYATNVHGDEAFQSKLGLTLNAFDNANFSATIENSTDGINTLVQKQVDLLYFRSAAYYQVGQFSKAISDAHTMIQLAPTQTLGYLRAGQLFSMNGNQKQAIKAYRMGLTMATGEHRDQLECECQQAEAKLHHRVDIIAGAPYEVLSHILSYLCGNDIVKMLGVCKEWQRRLSDPAELWSSLVIAVYRPDWYHLGFISHHVVELELERVKFGTCNKAMAQITLGKFSRLRSLAITDCVVPNNRNLFPALDAVSDTLLELTISPKESDRAIEFKLIMGRCPKIQKFRYSHRYIHRSPTFGTLPSNYVSSITSLDLDIPGLQESDIEETLRACPNLRSVCLGSGSPETLQLIRRYCANLDTLWYRTPRHTHSFRPKNPASVSTGIRNLCYSVMGNPHLEAVLNQVGETVEEFALSIPGMLRHYLYDNIPSMPNLRSLNILHCHNASMPGTKILAKTPGLEHIVLTGCNLRSVDFLESIQQLNYLKELDFTNVGTAIPGSIHTFMRTLAAKGTIQKIGFRRCKFVDDSLLSILAATKSLVHITVFCDDDDVRHITEQGLDDFCKSLRAHSAISFLSLGNVDWVTDSTLQILSTLPHLRILELTLPTKCTLRGLQYFNGKKVQIARVS